MIVQGEGASGRLEKGLEAGERMRTRSRRGAVVVSWAGLGRGPESAKWLERKCGCLGSVCPFLLLLPISKDFLSLLFLPLGVMFLTVYKLLYFC